MQEHIHALAVALNNSFPEDVIECIVYRTRSTDDGRDFDINSCWQYLRQPKNIRCIKAILKLGADINYRQPNTGATPIMYIAQTGSRDIVKFMIECGADLTITNSSGNTVYHYARLGNININDILREMDENRCQETTGKLSYLTHRLDEMNINDMTGLSHKKMKANGN